MGRVLHLVAVLGLQQGQDFLHVVESLVVDVERDPVPSFVQGELLLDDESGIQQDGLVCRAHQGAVLEDDALHVARQGLVGDAGAGVPCVEGQRCGAVVFGIAVDGEVDVALARLRVVGVVGRAHAGVAVEHAHQVGLVGRDAVVHVEAGAEVHAHVEVALVARPFGFLSGYLDGDGQRFGHAVVVDQVEHLVIRAYVDVLVDADGDERLVERVDVPGRWGHGHPFRHAFDGVAVLLSALVLDADVVFAPIGVGGDFQGLFRPHEVVAVDVDRHHHGAFHLVAVQVGNVLHGDVHRGVLDVLVRLVEVDDEFVVLGGETELDVLLHTQVAHRGEVGLVGQGRYVFPDEGVHLVGVVAALVDVAFHALGGEGQFVGVVHLLLVLAERQVGQQSQFVAFGADVVVVVDDVGRHGGLPETEVVDVSGQFVFHGRHRAPVVVAGTQVEPVRRDAAERVDGKGRAERVVHVDVAHIARAVHRHGVVVPFVVAVVARDDLLEAVAAVHQILSFEADEELVLRVHFVGASVAVGQQCAASSGVGLEPEHEGVVLPLGAGEEAFFQFHTVAHAVEAERQAVGQGPRGLVQCGRGSLGQVVEVGARSFVHRVVVQQSRFVAREALEAELAEFRGGEHRVPEACFQHVAHVRVGHLSVLHRGAAEQQRSHSVVVGCFAGGAFQQLVALVEAYLVCLGINRQGHLAEAAEGERVLRGEGLSVDAGLQAVVGCQLEQQGVRLAQVAEQGHRLPGRGRLDEHLDGQVLARQVALDGRSGIGVVGEVERRGLGDFAACGVPGHVEVVHLAQVVHRDVFAEGDADVVVDGQHAVGRFDVAERGGPARVLDARQDGRRTGDESVAVAAVGHGTQVVLLLNRVFLAEEAGLDVAVVANHGAGAVGGGVAGGVGVVTAQVGPVLLALGRDLVLQFDVVEASVVHVEAVDAYGHVVALVVGRLGVHQPLVRRRADVDVAGRGKEVGREADGVAGVDVAFGAEYDGQVFEVIAFAAAHLQHLVGRPGRGQVDGSSGGRQGRAVDGQFGPVRVASVHQGNMEQRVGVVDVLAFVHQLEVEHGRLVRRHVAHAGFLHLDARILDAQGAFVDDLVAVVEAGLVLVFVWAACGPAPDAVHQAAVAVDFVLVDELHEVVVALLADDLLDERLVVFLPEEVVGDCGVFLAVGLGFFPIDIDAHVRVELHV